MAHPLDKLINDIVADAAAKGALDNLPGAGKPLATTTNPKDALLNRMMTESRIKPLAVTLTEEIAASAQRLKALSDPDKRKAEMKVQADLQTRLAIEIEAMRKYG